MKISMLRRLIGSVGLRLVRVPDCDFIESGRAWAVTKDGRFLFHVWEDDLIKEDYSHV